MSQLASQKQRNYLHVLAKENGVHISGIDRMDTPECSHHIGRLKSEQERKRKARQLKRFERELANDNTKDGVNHGNSSNI